MIVPILVMNRGESKRHALLRTTQLGNDEAMNHHCTDIELHGAYFPLTSLTYMLEAKPRVWHPWVQFVGS